MTRQKKGRDWQQCESMFWRGISGIWCRREKGHDGDHRGGGAQWKQDGTRVSPPTIKIDRHGDPVVP